MFLFSTDSCPGEVEIHHHSVSNEKHYPRFRSELPEVEKKTFLTIVTERQGKRDKRSQPGVDQWKENSNERTPNVAFINRFRIGDRIVHRGSGLALFVFSQPHPPAFSPRWVCSERMHTNAGGFYLALACEAAFRANGESARSQGDTDGMQIAYITATDTRLQVQFRAKPSIGASDLPKRTGTKLPSGMPSKPELKSVPMSMRFDSGT
ncbi:membrane protein [Anopheles sinensis]|uniref:Membrane protein n=1 Tax=Anopheles sinensis TaxID=74873 RepID=A0A084WGU5_ANOSI|nr:membrane protein [Anopheles sinensis]